LCLELEFLLVRVVRLEN